LTAATSFVPSADDATQDQFVIGALVSVQSWADDETTVSRKPPKAATTTTKHFIFTALTNDGGAIVLQSRIVCSRPGPTETIASSAPLDSAIAFTCPRA
jgi:hypothetical protein